MKNKVIAIDFDATISNGRGWDGVEAVFHSPVERVGHALAYLREKGFCVVVYTARTDIKSVRMYLDNNDIPYDHINTHPFIPDNLKDHKVCGSKLVADVYVDDKAITFEGKWDKAFLDKITSFTPWIKRSNTPVRPSVPLNLFGVNADQIAIYCDDSLSMMKSYQEIGYETWICDKVKAIDEVTGSTLEVQLCFNYDIMPCEFELISLLSGSLPQIPTTGGQGLAHIGFHVTDIDEEVKKLLPVGNLITKVTTVAHSACPNRYQYALVDTRKMYGFFTKLITKIT